MLAVKLASGYLLNQSIFELCCSIYYFKHFGKKVDFFSSSISIFNCKQAHWKARYIVTGHCIKSSDIPTKDWTKCPLNISLYKKEIAWN